MLRACPNCNNLVEIIPPTFSSCARDEQFKNVKVVINCQCGYKGSTVIKQLTWYVNAYSVNQDGSLKKPLGFIPVASYQEMVEAIQGLSSEFCKVEAVRVNMGPKLIVTQSRK